MVRAALGSGLAVMFWDRFSRYDNSVSESTLKTLIQDNFASLTLQGPLTHRQLVERIAESARVPIPVAALPEILSQSILSRGRSIFGSPGNHFDQIARNYDGMQWWLSDAGLSMAVNPPLHQRLAAALDEIDRLTPQRRGFAFERFLNRMFTVLGLSPRKPFRLVGEQIDGSFELDHNLYLVEAKWEKRPIGGLALMGFAGAVRSKAAWSRGLYISYSGFSNSGLKAFSRTSGQIICLTGDELRHTFAHGIGLPEVLRSKVRHAAETGDAFKHVSKLSNPRRNIKS